MTNSSIVLTEITGENNYYPFGLKHKGYNSVVSSNTNAVATKFKYNGKELQDDLIGGNSLGLYDYGARFYDPQLARWYVIDNKAEKYNSITPYAYAANNPILFIDINGDSLWINYKKEKVLYENGDLYNKDGTAYSGKGMKVKKNGTVKYKGFLGKTYSALQEVDAGKEGFGMLREIEGSTDNMYIENNTGGGNSYQPGTNTIMFDPSSKNGGLNTRGQTNRPTFIGLGHEMAHGLDDLRGTLNLNRIPNQTFTYAEHFSTDMENKLRAEHSLPLRTHYGINAVGAGVYPLIDASGNSLHNGRYNYYDALKLTPKRALIPVTTVTPSLILK
ncbi:MAG: hypothetical protein DRI74_07200 [Bacteroidetes bacterium]|nr:MAG: hypothetical protein DRI74_07200 [Bacteroidota bacterium]